MRRLLIGLSLALLLTVSLGLDFRGGGGTSSSGTTITGIPPSLLWLGTGGEGPLAISSGVTTLTGEHHYSSLSVSGTAQIRGNATANASNFIVIIRVNGDCAIASTATCVKGDGTTDTACALDFSGTDSGGANGIGNADFGGSGGGGGAAGATNGGAGGAAVFTNTGTNFKAWALTGGSGGVVGGALPGVGKDVVLQSEQAFLNVLPSTDYLMAGTLGGPNNLAGANGGLGGAGTGTAGAAGKGGAGIVLVCKTFSVQTGDIVADGGPGGAGTTCGNAGGGGGGGSGALIVAGPGGYTGTKSIQVGSGGAPCAGGQSGAAGGKGFGWNCDTTAGTCTAL